MKILKIILIAIGTLVVLSLACFAYYGGFKKIEFRKQLQGGEAFAYEEIMGDYSQTPTVINRMYDSLTKYKIPTYFGVGVFFDDPSKVDKKNLRSEVGCILETDKQSDLVSIGSKFLVKTLPAGQYIITEFPYKGGMSAFVGMMKVYPALKKYMKENGIPENNTITEIYDVSNKRTIYRVLSFPEDAPKEGFGRSGLPIEGLY